MYILIWPHTRRKTTTTTTYAVWPHPLYLVAWENGGRANYSPELEDAMTFDTLRDAMHFVLERTYQAGRRNSPYNTGLQPARITEAQVIERTMEAL